MNDSVTSTKIPKWRIVIWALLGIVAFAWVGYAIGERGLVWAGVICIPLLITLLVGIIRLARSPNARRHLGLLIWTYVILQSILLLWQIWKRR